MHTNKNELSALKMLTARSDFIAMQNGDKWFSNGMILQIRENNLPYNRIGYTVSKKVNKSAVKRNRVKRRLRAVAADILSGHAKIGRDYVLIGRKDTIDRPYADLCKDLKWCLKRTGHLRDREPAEGDNG